MPEAIVPTAVDHLLAVVVVVAIPLLGRWNYRRFRELIATGGPDARYRQYGKEIRRQWVIAAGFVAIWLGLGRSLAGLGLTLPLGTGGLWGAGTTVLVVAFLLRQWRTVGRMTPEELAPYAGQVDAFRDLLPHTDREAARFRGLAVTAGVCEEIVFRGYLIAYLAAYLPVWPAAVLGGVAFGVAHAYQGVPGMIKTGATGVFTGVLYVGTGSLVWSMLIHAAIDLHGGGVGRRLLTDAAVAEGRSTGHA